MVKLMVKLAVVLAVVSMWCGGASASLSPGDLVSVSWTDSRVDRFDPSGTFQERLYPEPYNPPGPMIGYGIAVLGNSTVLVSRYDAQKVIQLDANGNLIGDFATMPSGVTPGAIETDGEGNAYVAGSDGKVRRYASNGSYLGVFADLGGGFNAADLAFGSTPGVLYISEYGSKAVYRSDGTTTTKYLDLSSYGNVLGIAVTDGKIFVNNYTGQTIFSFSESTGAYVNQYTWSEGPRPFGMTAGPDGRIYVAMEIGKRVDVINADLSGQSVFGTAGSSWANPVDIAFAVPEPATLGLLTLGGLLLGRRK